MASCVAQAASDGATSARMIVTDNEKGFTGLDVIDPIRAGTVPGALPQTN
jgi:hypothetical protein